MATQNKTDTVTNRKAREGGRERERGGGGGREREGGERERGGRE